MNQALVAAQQILTDLNDIQPIISVKGLVEASTTIKDMKKNASVLIAALTPVHPRLEQVVKSRKVDMQASFKGLIETIPFETPSELISDQQLASMGVAAEIFALRCSDYIKSNEHLNQIKKDNMSGDCDVN